MNLPWIDKIFFRVSTLDILLFTKHLSVMIKSGIPLNESIASLKDQTKSGNFKKILTDVLKEIENGQALEKALSKYKNVFSPLYISLAGIGEKSGNLEDNLEYLAINLKKTYEFNKKIQGALLYPKLVLAATFVMGMFISLFVLPKLVDLFRSLDVKLPLSTKILLFVANIMKNFGIIIFLGLIALISLISLLLKTGYVKPKWHQVLLALPIIGPFKQNIELTAICRNLGLMLKSGLTITTALEAQLTATDNLVYQSYLAGLLKSTEKGKKLSEEMKSAKYPYIPAIMSRMIGVGEETGKLEDMLAYLGDFFEEEADDYTKNLSTTLEPILLLIIGVMVAFVSLAIISPIYQLTGSIHK